MKELDNKVITELLEKLGVQPKKYSLYVEALTHPSYANDHHLSYNYERLEFLGDSVISLIVANFLYNNFPNAKVGVLSKTRTMMVQSKAIVIVANKINLKKYLNIGKSLANITDYSKILEDTFEALIGAIYLDQGIYVAAKVIVDTICKEYKQDHFKGNVDYKTEFQELIMKYGKGQILYRYEQSPDNQFLVKLYCNNICYGTGLAPRKKDAEQQAAKEACEKFASKKGKN